MILSSKIKSRYLLIVIWFISVVQISCSDNSEPSKPEEIILKTDSGLVSYYGKAFDGNKTASGEIFDSREMVAAHPDYPMGTIVRVTSLENGDTVTVRISDRGPTKVNQHEGVIIDISRGAAEKLKMVSDGRIKARVEVLKWGENEQN